MVLVDSSVWIDFFRDVVTPQTDRLAQLLRRRPIPTGDLVLTEVLQGFPEGRRFDEAHRLMRGSGTLRIVDEDVAVAAARHYRTLRARGVTVRRTIDTLIATRCIADDIPLLYSDRDFDPFVEHLGLRSALDMGA